MCLVLFLPYLAFLILSFLNYIVSPFLFLPVLIFRFEFASSISNFSFSIAIFFFFHC